MSLSSIKYLSDKRIADLKKLGIFSLEDLAKNFPRSYLDLRESQFLKYAYHNDIVLTCGKVPHVAYALEYFMYAPTIFDLGENQAILVAELVLLQQLMFLIDFLIALTRLLIAHNFILIYFVEFTGF